MVGKNYFLKRHLNVADAMTRRVFPVGFVSSDAFQSAACHLGSSIQDPVVNTV